MQMVYFPSNISKTRRKRIGKSIARAKKNLKAHKNPAMGYVYVFSLGHDNLYKIGVSQDYEQRLKDLQASNPKLRPIIVRRVPSYRSAEKLLHALMTLHKVDREVFQLKQSQLDEIDSTLAELQQSLIHSPNASPHPDQAGMDT